MHFLIPYYNLSIEISVGERRSKHLLPVEGTPQDNPRRSYVYAHTTIQGRYFYIGKGTGNRAWSSDRHPLWYRYVDTHLGGEYRVVILQDNLSSEEAEELESEWIAQESETLVNWFNVGRKFDYAKLDYFQKLRDVNRSLITSANTIERTNLNDAIQMYIQAISKITEYADIEYESGLIGQLLREERTEVGRSGEIDAIDRLSLCLIRCGRVEEASFYVKDYFEKFKADSRMVASTQIFKRIEKALLKKGADMTGMNSNVKQYLP